MQDGHDELEQAYVRHLPTLTLWVGWYALFCGDRLGGLFPTKEAAVRAGEILYPSRPVLIRRIEGLSPLPFGPGGGGKTFHA